MSEHDGSREWPLVIFTMALQLTCGLALVTTMADLNASSAGVESMRRLGIAMFPVLAVGFVASLLHLGQCHSAWKTLLNLSHSRLSAEVLLTLLFALGALLDSVFWLSGRAELRFALGVGTVILGVAAVISSAMVYMVATQPMWNSGWLLTSFVGTMLLVAGVFGTTCVPSVASDTLLRLFLGQMIVGGVLSLISAFWMRNLFLRLSRGRSIFIHLPLVPDRRNLGSWLSFGLYVLLTGILPLAFAIGMWPRGSGPIEVSALRFAPAGVVSIILGATLGRSLMYSTGIALSHF